MRSQTGRGAFAWAMLVPTLALGQAAPDPAPANGLALRWNDPDALAAATEAEFEARLSEQLGRPAFDRAASQHVLVVSWGGTAEQCRVELQLLSGLELVGTRALQSPNGDCRSLNPALLTVAALLIEALPAETVTETPPPPPPLPPPRQPQAPARRAPDHEAPIMLSLGAVVASGLAPELELGPAASLVFAPIRHLRVGALGAVFFPDQYAASPGFSLGHSSIALLTCGMPLSGSFGLGLCGNAALHRYSSEGLSLPHPESHQTSAWTAGVSMRAEWRLVRQLWWVGNVGADVATRPLYFYFTPAAGGETVLFRQRRVAPAVFLGLTLELP